MREIRFLLFTIFLFQSLVVWASDDVELEGGVADIVQQEAMQQTRSSVSETAEQVEVFDEGRDVWNHQASSVYRDEEAAGEFDPVVE